MSVSFADLKVNKKSIQLSDLKSLVAMLIPPLGFFILLIYLVKLDQKFAFLMHPSEYPLEFVIMILFGIIATIGGIADWFFHRLYVTVGPNERHAHWIVLATGGIPLFILMSCASLSATPMNYLIPIIIVSLYTSALICYDEFIFHWKRCCKIETLFHRMLVFGNATAWLAWVHWCFVRGI
jgi:hypothetical protein